MNKNIKRLLTGVFIAVIGIFGVMSCKSDADDLGGQFFTDDVLEGVRENYDIVAYNKSNGDKIQADAKTLQIARIGAFTEGVFGKQKASYVSQVNLSSYDPKFGQNAVLDSAVMYLTPFYNTQEKVETSINFQFPDGNGGTIPATQEITSYPIFKYGNQQINGQPVPLKIRVHEVTDFLKSTKDTVYSDETINYTNLLGEKIFNGKVNKIKFVGNDNDDLLFEAPESLRIPLDANFFQSKIIDQEGSNHLKDLASFIRYFRGVRISVEEDDGYLFGINPNQATIVLYYKHDGEGQGADKVSAKYIMGLGAGNVHIGQYQYDRLGSTVETALNAVNELDGDNKLYLQGMGGSGAVLKIPMAVIATLKDKYRQEKIGIIGAKIRVYVDDQWSNEYEKPDDFVFLEQDADNFLSESVYIGAVPSFKFVTPYLDESPAYYDLAITKTLKNAIEDDEFNEDIILDLNVGSFRVNPENGLLLGYQATTRAYAPERLVLIGSDTNSEHKIQLQVTYAKK